MSQVCLIQMPYTDLELPSLALGLLKRYLSQRQISVSVIYANLEFASFLGVDVYRAILEETPPEGLVGEWTFAKAAFPEADFDEAAFLELVAPYVARGEWLRTIRRLHRDIDGPRLLTAIRDGASEFLDSLVRRIVASGAQIVGCTSTFQQHCASLALLRRVKALAPHTVTMLGGGNCEGVMGATAHEQFPWLDFVMSGEVDGFFGELCERILQQGVQSAARHAPEGVFTPRERGRVSRLPVPRALLHTMDDAAVPDYDDYFEALDATPFARHVAPGLLFESSRGCWWGMKHHCTFCGLSDEGMVFRSKSPQRVVEEIASLQARYGVNWLYAVDYIIDIKYVRSVLPALGERENRPYLFYEVKANLKREHVQLLARAGIRRMQPGIESLHDDVLKLLDKGNRWFTNVQLLKWAQEAGITVAWNFLCGAPGEQDAWYQELADWLPAISHLQPPDSDALSTIRYYRFSVYHSSPDRFGLRLVPNREYALVYPIAADALMGLAYFFEDTSGQPIHAGGPGRFRVSEEIAAWRRAFDGGHDRAPARLVAHDDGTRITIRDTRPVRTAAVLTCEGLERAIVRACDCAQTRAGLNTALRADGRDDGAAAIDAAVERLTSDHLLLEWRDHLVSLPVNEPVTPYVTAGRPGLINMTAWQRHTPASRFVRAAQGKSTRFVDDSPALAPKGH